MKNLKSIFYVALILLIVTACTSDNESLKIESEQVDYKKVSDDVNQYVLSFKSDFATKESIAQNFQFTSANKSLESDGKIITINLELDKDIINFDENNLGNYFSETQKDFLENYLNEVGNSYDYELLQIIQKYKTLLSDANFNKEEFDQLMFVLNTAEKTTESVTSFLDKSSYTGKSSDNLVGKSDPFWDCMKKNAGKSIGRGLAFGFITGFTAGAIAGATGGTVVVPVVGTVVGGVGVGVVTGAVNGVRGAIGGALWAAADCSRFIGGSGGGGGCGRVVEKPYGNDAPGMVFQVCNN